MLKDICSFQVSPSEVDATINALSTVADCGTTAVYSDDEGSELPVAYVVPKGFGTMNEAMKRKFAFEVRAEVERKLAKVCLLSLHRFALAEVLPSFSTSGFGEV